MSLHKFTPSEGSSFKKRRVGRGIGSGMGKTATRGTKGQKARRQIHPNFEGGQSPIQKRLPVKKGFRNVNHKVYAIINLDDLENLFKAGEEVTPEALYATGIVSQAPDGVKVLAFGTLTKKLKVKAHKFSKTAQEAIEKAGGSIEELSATKLTGIEKNAAVKARGAARIAKAKADTAVKPAAKKPAAKKAAAKNAGAKA
jgi:large subunit ribosomal protein L15